MAPSSPVPREHFTGGIDPYVVWLGVLRRIVVVRRIVAVRLRVRWFVR